MAGSRHTRRIGGDTRRSRWLLLGGLAGLAGALLVWPRSLLLPAVLLNVAVGAHLALASLRRLALTTAALVGRDPPAPPPPAPPQLTVLVPCRDEAAALPATLAAWDAVDYPHERLEAIFVDDASADQTPRLLAEFARSRPWAKVIRREGPAEGKGAALLAGLAAAAPSDAAAVFDADARPAADCLRRLTARLADPTVAAVAGRMLPDEGEAWPARYAALESAVHQRLTITGAARLGLTVPLLGSAYLVRRPLLDELGFAPAHRLEDIDLTMRLLAGRRRIAWTPDARCAHRPPAEAAAFRAQRAAWGRGFHRVASERLRAGLAAARSPLAAIDCLLFCGGYLDRLSFAAGLALCLAQALGAPELWAPWQFLAVVAVVPLLQAPVAAVADGWPWRRIARSAPALALAALDLGAEAEALLADLRRRPLRWTRQRRAGEDG